MRVEFFQTILTHLGDPSGKSARVDKTQEVYSQVLRTPGDSTSFLQAMTGVTALLLTEHEVLCTISDRSLNFPREHRTVVVLAVSSNKKSRALERRAGHTKLFDFGHRAG